MTRAEFEAFLLANGHQRCADGSFMFNPDAAVSMTNPKVVVFDDGTWRSTDGWLSSDAAENIRPPF